MFSFQGTKPTHQLTNNTLRSPPSPPPQVAWSVRDMEMASDGSSQRKTKKKASSAGTLAWS